MAGPGMTLARERVYDPVLRLIHLWNGLLITVLLAGGQVIPLLDFDWPAIPLWHLHRWLGYGLVLGLGARLIWGLTGPGHARWRAMWWPAAWLRALRQRRFFTAPERFGHHPLASGAYLAAYLLLFVLAGTGLVLAAIDQDTGPLYPWLAYAVEWKAPVRLVHELAQYGVALFLLAHLAALILHESRHGVPVAQAMVSGYQYLPESRLARDNPPSAPVSGNSTNSTSPGSSPASGM